MTLLTLCQEAAVQIMSRSPSTFFSSQANFELELRTLANVAARDIARSHEWQALTKLASMTGDGTSEGYDLPSDYDRLPVKADVHSPDWTTWRYTPARDLDQFLDFQNGLSIARPGAWVLLGGQMKFWPILSSGEGAQFYYLSKNFVRPESGDPKSSFTADSDTFILPEELLSSALIWRWRSLKRLEYSEDMANYERMFSQIAGKDKGGRIIATGPSRMPYDASYAYPRTLG